MKKRGNSWGGEALGVAKPVSPPHTPPFRARHCATPWRMLIYRLSPVCCCIGGVRLSRFFCPAGRESGPRSGPVPCFWREQVYVSDMPTSRNRSATQTAFRTVHTIGTDVHGQYSSIQAFANTLPHIITQNSDVPGKGEREGEKRAS